MYVEQDTQALVEKETTRYKAKSCSSEKVNAGLVCPQILGAASSSLDPCVSSLALVESFTQSSFMVPSPGFVFSFWYH